jgi:flagellar biosynthetic protein FliQ
MGMGADQALGLFNQLLWTAMLVAAPVLLVTLAVGLVVSILQVATQLQETTLHFIPKMLAAALMLVAVGPWMIHKITEFAPLEE